MAEHGVYRIRNLLNSKCYIGSAAGYKGFVGRWLEHRRDVNSQKHHSVIFQRAWNKYGEDNFVFEVLEECEPRLCIEREQYYLDTILFAQHNDSRFSQLGYNICKTAGSRLGMKHSDDTKARMSQNSKGKTAGVRNGRAKLSQDDIDGIRNQHCGRHGQLSQLARRYKVCVSTIKRIVDGTTWSNA